MPTIKKYPVLPALSILLFTFAVSGCMKPAAPAADGTPGAVVQTRLLSTIRQIDTTLGTLHHEMKASASDTASRRTAQAAFLEARRLFKQTEFLIAYYYPGSAEELNGAPLEEVAEDDPNNVVEPPQGFQSLETFLFPVVDTAALSDAYWTISELRAVLRRVAMYAEKKPIADVYLFDAMRQEFARLASLGLSGFDSPAAQNTRPELASSLRNLRSVASLYESAAKEKGIDSYTKLCTALDEAVALLEKNPKDLDGFDRLGFLTDYLNPAAVALCDVRDALGIADNRSAYQLFSGAAKTVFDANAFNALAFVPDYARTANAAAGVTASTGVNASQVGLGQLLFNDPVLSENGKRACASCHQPQHGFTDGLTRAMTLSHDSTLLRNTPTLLNAAFQASSSYDQSTVYLEDRVVKVLESPNEMHSSLRAAAEKLSRSSDYRDRFQKAFGVQQAGGAGASGESLITADHIKVALGAYMRSLKSFNARFDRYMRGERTAMNEREKRGFNLFMGKGKCGTCHFMPLFNGTVPPTYGETEAEVIGVPAKPDTANAVIDSDAGKYALHQIELQRYMFKTPTVRNAELTAPYMHNGVYKTLEEVMDFYNRGGGWGIGIELANQTLPAEKLNLSQSELQEVIAFMKTLTDTTGLASKPASLPKFDNAKLNVRKVGGEY